MTDPELIPQTHDLIPVPHAATIELGRDKKCPRNCAACAFNETELQKLTPDDIIRSMTVLAKYWDDVQKNPEFQLVGARFIEFIGIAGAMNLYSREDFQRIFECAKSLNLAQIAFMCDAALDERAIRDFFTLHAESGASSRAVVALSVDAIPVGELTKGRDKKSAASWEMLGNKSDYIQNPEKQNFRAFVTMSKQNLKDIPEIALQILEGGNLLFIAPLTAHSEEMLAQTLVQGRLLMGTDTSVLVTDEDKPLMEKVVAELRELKQQYPQQFLNGDANFDNMLAACKPIMEVFRNNCRESCSFTLKNGDQLNCTPNIRVLKKPGEDDMSLGVCTCFVGPSGSGEHYADTKLGYLEHAGEDPEQVVSMYRTLTSDLAHIACPGCNCRTAIDIRRGGLK